MKGVIAAGGMGTRLYPLTNNISKHLLPVFNKPLIYYPLTNLIAAGIREICVVANSKEIQIFKNLLGDGSHVGCDFHFKIQEKPLGIPNVISNAYKVFGKTSITLILSDNVITASDILIEIIRKKQIIGSQIFATKVNNSSRFGVINFNKNMVIKDLQEKPNTNRPGYAVIGLYIFDDNVYSYLNEISVSKRGELEIIDILKKYNENKKLKFNLLKRGTMWFDAGTPDSLIRASNYIQAFEKQTGIMIGCYEEAALERGFINKAKLKRLCSKMPSSNYKSYLLNLIN